MRYINMIRCAVVGLVMTGAVAGHAQEAGSSVDLSASAGSYSAKKAQRAANRALQKAVLRSLSQTRGLNVANILVVARGSVVTLAGSVPDSSQIELAVSAAKAVSGVSEVRNDLIVRSEGT